MRKDINNPALLYLHGGPVQPQAPTIMLLQESGQMSIPLSHGIREIVGKTATKTKMIFDEIDAPYKELYIMEDTIHGLLVQLIFAVLESKSGEFSKFLHEITKTQEDNR
ncbi:MAG: hypothetical protein NC307_03435 [Roseburia sp.]|nr:hypothetical protein [Roseburia sp.]